MALTRKFLQAMGIEADKIDEIIDAHAETVNGLTDQINSLKEQADKVEGLTKENEDLKKAAKEGGDPFEKKYNDLKAEHDKLVADNKAAESKRAKESAVRALLKEKKYSEKGIDKILKYQDLTKVELEDGKIKDADKLAESLKGEWGEYIVSEGTKGAQTSSHPDTSGKPGSMTKDQIMAIKDDSERQAAMLANAELFGFSKGE